MFPCLMVQDGSIIVLRFGMTEYRQSKTHLMVGGETGETAYEIKKKKALTKQETSRKIFIDIL